jgi:hypothetical protein
MSASRRYPIDLMTSDRFFGNTFAAESWNSWRTLFKSISGLPLTDTEQRFYLACTGTDYRPSHEAWSLYRELWLCIGRGGGKSFIAAYLMVCLVIKAIVDNTAKKMGIGTTLVVMSISATRRQAEIVYGYALALVNAVPMLRTKVSRTSKTSIEFEGGVRIECHTASFRSTRGFNCLGAVLDEVAFWRFEDTSKVPDTEIYRALLPLLARVPGSLLVGISSPYARKGLLWSQFTRLHGKADAHSLFEKAPSLDLNPTLDRAIIDQALREDESAALSKWFAEFRSDLESYADIELIRSLVIPDRRELPPQGGIEYVAFCDPAGGSGADSL